MFNDRIYSGSTSNFLQKVYAWMSVGLLATAGTAYYISQNISLVKFFFGNPWLLFTLLLIQIGLVVGLSVGVNKLSFSAAAIFFLGYSVLNGITLSSIFLVYTPASIALAFLVSAGMFLTMAVYGYFTKADLSSMGSFLLMALFGLIFAGFLNLLFKSNSFTYLLSGAGVIIFSLLTAFDVQKLKVLAQQMSNEALTKVTIIGALTLYLDFINLFLYLLRFMGQQKRD